MTIESLKKQLEATEQELELAKGHVHRCDGAIQLLRHLIAKAEEEVKGVVDTTILPAEAEQGK